MIEYFDIKGKKLSQSLYALLMNFAARGLFIQTLLFYRVLYYKF